MKRRDFLRSTLLATLGGFTVHSFSNPLVEALRSSTADDRVLVVVQLSAATMG